MSENIEDRMAKNKVLALEDIVKSKFFILFAFDEENDMNFSCSGELTNNQMQEFLDFSKDQLIGLSASHKFQLEKRKND